ncbi:collagen alpha-1(I) chain-like [Phasianus colchicus]|uniref:collagen alpha-1(I) chain-like n=1 Tax=Phasianus colchicus TaxID=9054 RepID=UPI00129D6522|nr:collagen alpha-1(I) chain-like [Phasianus colchicus]
MRCYCESGNSSSPAITEGAAPLPQRAGTQELTAYGIHQIVTRPHGTQNTNPKHNQPAPGRLPIVQPSPQQPRRRLRGRATASHRTSTPSSLVAGQKMKGRRKAIRVFQPLRDISSPGTRTPRVTGTGQRTLPPSSGGSPLRRRAVPCGAVPPPAASRSRSQAPLRRRLGTAPGITTPRAQTQGEGEGGQTERRAPGLPGPAGGPVPTQEAGGPGSPRASPADGSPSIGPTRGASGRVGEPRAGGPSPRPTGRAGRGPGARSPAGLRGGGSGTAALLTARPAGPTPHSPLRGAPHPLRRERRRSRREPLPLRYAGRARDPDGSWETGAKAAERREGEGGAGRGGAARRRLAPRQALPTPGASLRSGRGGPEPDSNHGTRRARPRARRREGRARARARRRRRRRPPSRGAGPPLRALPLPPPSRRHAPRAGGLAGNRGKKLAASSPP